MLSQGQTSPEAQRANRIKYSPPKLLKADAFADAIKIVRKRKCSISSLQFKVASPGIYLIQAHVKTNVKTKPRTYTFWYMADLSHLGDWDQRDPEIVAQYLKVVPKVGEFLTWSYKPGQRNAKKRKAELILKRTH